MFNNDNTYDTSAPRPVWEFSAVSKPNKYSDHQRKALSSSDRSPCAPSHGTGKGRSPAAGPRQIAMGRPKCANPGKPGTTKVHP